MTYTNATKDTYVPPACSQCGAPTDVDWVDVGLDRDAAEIIGERWIPQGHPDRPYVPGRATCSARRWEDGHTAPPCPRCGADGAINWPEITGMGDAQTRIVRGSNYCTERCPEDLPTSERRALYQQYPGWSW